MAEESVFPEKIIDYRCPACGKRLSGQSYNLDAELPKCKGKWHKASPIKATYVLEAKAHG